MLTFTRAVTVAAGDPLTSAQMASLAAAYNDRLRSGLGDPTFRIAFWWLSLFRQVRNPDEGGTLFPALAEFFTAGYQALQPGDGDWPVAAAGDPEGANLAYRITVETGTVGGTTNSVNYNVRLDYGTAKDLTRINGLVYAWNQYQKSGGANDLGTWLKQDVKDRSDSYAAVKQQADNATLLAKLQSLLLANPDLLSASDLSSLNAIAAKAP